MTIKTPMIQKRAFTLIEVLVVIAIIGILAGLLFPMASKALLSAKRNTAVADANSIAAGIQLFYKEYGYMPIGSTLQGSDKTDGPALSSGSADTASKGIIEVLLGDNTNLNPKGISYLDADFAIVDGDFQDPWGKQYLILLDLNLDNKIKLSPSSIPHTKRAIVVSRGPDGIYDSSSDGDDVANVLLNY